MSEGLLEFRRDQARDSAAIRFRMWDKEDCVEVDFPASCEALWTYLTREQAGQVVEFLQRFLSMQRKRAV